MTELDVDHFHRRSAWRELKLSPTNFNSCPASFRPASSVEIRLYEGWLKLTLISFQVTGVVGRAEMLSSVFFLGALLCYARAASRRRYTGKSSIFFFYIYKRKNWLTDWLTDRHFFKSITFINILMFSFAF